jgi:mercuric ion binding protein
MPEKGELKMRLRTLMSILLLLMSLSILPAPGQAEITRAVVAVEGMSCPFCAFGVEKKLKAVGGVRDVTVDMGRSTATLAADEGKSLDTGQINAAVKASGFTPGALKITAVGTLSSGEKEEDLLLRIRSTDQVFRLVNLPEPLRDRLQALSRSGVAIKISGEAHKPVDGLPGLEPETIEELGR